MFGWLQAGLQKLTTENCRIGRGSDDHGEYLEIFQTLQSTGPKPIRLEFCRRITANADGSWHVELNCRLPENAPSLPRIGTISVLAPDFEQVEYFGRGPHENYIDRNSSAFIGRYASTVTAQYVPYVRPQDCGYKTDVRWVEFTDADGGGVRFGADRPFFVQALHYGWEDLEFARHRTAQQRFRSPPRPHAEVLLNLDCRQRGLGGESCGPNPPLPEYTFPVEETRWTVTLAPLKCSIYEENKTN